MMKSLRLLAIAKKTVLFEQSSNRFFTINEIYGEIKIPQSELQKMIKPKEKRAGADLLSKTMFWYVSDISGVIVNGFGII